MPRIEIKEEKVASSVKGRKMDLENSPVLFMTGESFDMPVFEKRYGS